jgi:hypothetical protein
MSIGGNTAYDAATGCPIWSPRRSTLPGGSVSTTRVRRSGAGCCHRLWPRSWPSALPSGTTTFGLQTTYPAASTGDCDGTERFDKLMSSLDVADAAPRLAAAVRKPAVFERG